MSHKKDKSPAKRKKPRIKGAQHSKDEAARYNHDLLAQSWQARDELYMQLFGQHQYISPSNYAPPAKLKSKTKGNGLKDNNLNQQELAVFTYAPDPLRPYWTHITAGLSTPWLQDDAQEVSGFGLELMIKSPTEAEWPAQILRTMAYYIFNHMGTLSPSKRLALNSPIIAGSDSLLRNLLIWYADEAPDCWYQLPSGGFGIFAAVGITDDEMRLTESIHEEYGTWCMLQILKRLGLDQTTDPSRKSIMERENISSIIDSVQEYAQYFHNTFPAANRLSTGEEEGQN